MPTYKGVLGTIRSIETNPLNHKYAVIVEATNDEFKGRYFQVKFCQQHQRNNINEFIGHYISKLINAPVLEGAFIKIHDEELEKLKTKMNRLSIYKPIDTNISKNGFFFGVEWMKDLNEIQTHKELLPKVQKTSNSAAFYSIFPLDQITKNGDRHLDNHLISKQKNKLVYNIIDFDRIFAGTSWIHTTTLKKNWDCLRMPTGPNQFNELEFLYSLVNNNSYITVRDYAIALSNIQNTDIDDMCDVLETIYRVHKSEVDTIRQWFLHRKENIYAKCIESKCFKNVKQQRLDNVYRHNIQTTNKQL